MAMRKRGKSRLSSASKRTARWRAKYTTDAVTKRAKKLLPIMYPQLKDMLIVWDSLEIGLFAKYEELGIPLDQYDYYTKWAKRKAEKGLRFGDTTREAEYYLLKSEFIQRGLDSDLLDAVEVVVEEWLSLMYGAVENIVNGGFEYGSFYGWTVSGQFWEIKDDIPHSGVYYARAIVMVSPCYIMQTFPSPIDKTLIVDFYLWSKCSAIPPLAGIVTIGYSDTTTTDVELPQAIEWTQTDLKPYVEDGKKVSYIQIKPQSGAISIRIDDVSLISGKAY